MKAGLEEMEATVEINQEEVNVIDLELNGGASVSP
jgi:hypothetical protein